MRTKKPRRGVEGFVSGGRADSHRAQGVDYMQQRDKMFLLRIPFGLHEAAKKRAGIEGKSLHSLILEGLARVIA